MDFDGHKYADLALKLVFFYLQAIHRAAGSVKARKAVIEQVDKLTDWLRIMSKTAEQLQELKVVEGSSSKPGIPRAA